MSRESPVIGPSVGFFNLLREPSIFQWGNPSVVGKPMNSCTLEKLKIGRQYSDNGAYYNSKSRQHAGCHLPGSRAGRQRRDYARTVPISDIEKISTMSRHENTKEQKCLGLIKLQNAVWSLTYENWRFLAVTAVDSVEKS